MVKLGEKNSSHPPNDGQTHVTVSDSKLKQENEWREEELCNKPSMILAKVGQWVTLYQSNVAKPPLSILVLKQNLYLTEHASFKPVQFSRTS